MKAREKIWKLIKTKILGAKVRYRLFLSKTPVLFRKSVIKYPMGVSFAAAKRRMRNMRQMEFKMERQGLLEEGQEVNVTESALPTSYYYTITPAVAMSRNYQAYERLQSRKGIVKEVKETPRGFYTVVEFDEDEPT